MFQIFCSYFSLSELKWHLRAFGYYPKLITYKNNHPNGCLVGVGIGSADEMLKAHIFLLVSNSFNEASRSRRGLWFEVMGIHVCWFWQTIPIFKHVRDYLLCPYCLVSSCHFFNFWWFLHNCADVGIFIFALGITKACFIYLFHSFPICLIRHIIIESIITAFNIETSLYFSLK